MNGLLDYLEAQPIPRNRCHYCHGDFWLDFITKDHIVPKARGGKNATWNYVPSCEPCNTAKGMNAPTCECVRCQTAIARDPRKIIRQTFATRSTGRPIGGIGAACKDCGCITMTPLACPWCYNLGVINKDNL